MAWHHGLAPRLGRGAGDEDHGAHERSAAVAHGGQPRAVAGGARQRLAFPGRGVVDAYVSL